MAVKIRLRRMGAKKAPYYRIVVADSRYPRDGRFIEEIGTYNPVKTPTEVKVDADKAKQWIRNLIVAIIIILLCCIFTHFQKGGIIFGLILGLIGGLITNSINVKSMKPVAERLSAGEYVGSKKVNVSAKEDRYINTTTKKEPINKN